MRKKTLIWAISAAVLLLIAAAIIWAVRQKPDAIEEPAPPPVENVTAPSAPTPAEIEAARQAGKIAATIDTAQGQIVVELRGDLMPLTVANFTKLAKAGFYDGLKFHRVEDWVIQGGDPQGSGYGGPGYTIKLETHPQMKNVRGAIAMARSSHPDSAGSQFYILRTDASWLDGQYAVFGQVVSGMDAVDKMQANDKIIKVSVGQE